MGYPLSSIYLAGFTAPAVIATAAAMTMPPQPAKRWTVATLALGALWALADFARGLQLVRNLLPPSSRTRETNAEARTLRRSPSVSSFANG